MDTISNSRPKEHINARIDKDLLTYVNEVINGPSTLSEKLRRLIIQHKMIFEGNNLILTTDEESAGDIMVKRVNDSESG